MYENNLDQWMKAKEVGHNYLEKPAMYAKLPILKSKKVLCLGCGAGEECNHIESLGAKIIGVDKSRQLLSIARKNYPNVDFRNADINNLKFPRDYFDYIYSSLAFHYIKDWKRLFKSIRKILKRNGTLLFSTHNPISFNKGHYLKSRKINDIWFKSFKVTYYHRTFSDMMKEILDSGLFIEDIVEPKPLASSKKIDGEFWEKGTKIPLFIIFELKKK